jgi:hypothetical protein
MPRTLTEAVLRHNLEVMEAAFGLDEGYEHDPDPKGRVSAKCAAFP